MGYTLGSNFKLKNIKGKSAKKDEKEARTYVTYKYYQ